MVTKHLSITDLQRELSNRQQALAAIESKHKALAAQLQGLESEMAAIRGAGAATKGRPGRKARRGRPPGAKSAKGSTGSKAPKRGTDGRTRRTKNEKTLPDTIIAAVKVGAVVSPKEAAALAKNNGYKSASKTFGIQVATILAKDKRFKRKGRGQYERVK